MTLDPRWPFEILVPVRDDDIDGMGHVNNIVYLRWVQEVAIAHWRVLATEEEQADIAWVVLRHEIDYKAPARVGEQIKVKTWVGVASGITFERHTEVSRVADGRALAIGRTLWCPINALTGRPQRVTPELRSRFSVPATPG